MSKKKVGYDLEKTTLKLYTWRYIFSAEGVDDDCVGVKYVTDTSDGIERFDAAIIADGKVHQCFREYVGEVDCSCIGAVVPVVGCEKKEEENEEV